MGFYFTIKLKSFEQKQDKLLPKSFYIQLQHGQSSGKKVVCAQKTISLSLALFSLSKSVALKTYKDIRETEETEKKIPCKKRRRKRKGLCLAARKREVKERKMEVGLTFCSALFYLQASLSLSLSISLTYTHTHTHTHIHTHARTLTQFFSLSL